jgi:hypothetical protein
MFGAEADFANDCIPSISIHPVDQVFPETVALEGSIDESTIDRD